MASSRLNIFSNPRLWVVVGLFASCIVLHYPQQIIKIDSPSVFSFLGLSRHAAERILLLIPVVYTALSFGTRAGLISLAAATVIMVPRVFLLSEFMPDSVLETVGVVFIGGMIILWFNGYRKDKQQHLVMLSKLEMAYRELQDHARTVEEDERRLATLNQIASTVSSSLELNRILNDAIDNVMNTMRVDAAWIFLLNHDGAELLLAAHRGFPEGLPRIKLGAGLSGRVAQTGKELVLDDVSTDPQLPNVIRQNMRSVVIVPLCSKGNIKGTLGVSSRSLRSFNKGEIELLTSIGDQIGVAVDNAQLYQRQQEVMEELRISEQRYRELFENAHDAIWVHDMDGKLIAANQAAEALTGYTIRELLKMNVKSFYTEENINSARNIRRLLFDGKPFEQPYEQQLVRRDGSHAILKLTSNLLKEEGRPTGFLHIARDVTVEKEMQDKLSAAYRQLTESHQKLKESQEQLILAEKLTSLGQLAASVAHEINNPLSGVLNYIQLLIKKIGGNSSFPKETSLDYLHKMETEVTRSTKLVRNLLDFGRQSPPSYREVNMNEVIIRSLDLVRHSATMHHVHIIQELDPALPTIMADFDQLLQVCTNLILNAIQAMTDGGKLTLVTRIGNDQVIIEVQDTGCGISPENMRKIFTPFFTTKSEVKGVGLGLAVSYGIVQRHKGRIEVQSKLGEGTSFSVCLPLHPGDPVETFTNMEARSPRRM